MRHDNDLRDDPQEREISLGTATILGIFLALALVCAAFFGFGYSIGRHSGPTPAPAAAPAEAKSDSPFSNFKSPSTTGDSDNAATDNSQADAPAAAVAPALPVSNEKAPAQVAPPRETVKPQPAAHSVAFPVPASPAAVAPSTGGTQFVVQVSATSRRGDAEALIAALKQKGYVAAIRQEPQDKLFHVQLGPFASKPDAETMRKRLDTDGYKAIVK